MNGSAHQVRLGLCLMLVFGVPRAGLAVERRPRVDPKSGLELVFIEPARITLGCERRDRECFDDEKPVRSVAVTGFWINRTEVTVDAYDRCRRAGACSSDVTAPSQVQGAAADLRAWSLSCNEGRLGREKHPINCVDWAQARRFCEWVGGRLPTAREWERTAKGAEGRIYPWGDDSVTAERANLCDRDCHRAHREFVGRLGESDGWAETAPVGSFSKGASRDGVLDLAGNVWEWTATQYDAANVEIRGGGWTVDEPRWFRSSNRSWWPPSTRALDLGFRCVINDGSAKHLNRKTPGERR